MTEEQKIKHRKAAYNYWIKNKKELLNKTKEKYRKEHPKKTKFILKKESEILYFFSIKEISKYLEVDYNKVYKRMVILGLKTKGYKLEKIK